MPFTPRSHRILPLSAKTPAALGELAARYRHFLTDETPLADAASTAATGRTHFAHRAGVVFRNLDELQEQLALVEAGSGRKAAARKVAFLYTGQGSQWPGMGRDLYESEPAFREVLDRCEAAFRGERGESLLPVMFKDAGRLDRTEWTQPALYALECGLTALWASLGVRPDAVFGHSVGELAAAQAAGVFGLEEGLRFAARRGALMGSLPAGGAMAALFAPVERVEKALPPGVSLAAENGAHCVVSGPEKAVVALAQSFTAAGARAERLRTSHGFHSALLDPVLDELEAAAPAGAAVSAPLVGNPTGRVVSEALDGGYWRRQAREPVRFRAAVETLADMEVGMVVEVGPHGVLGPMAGLAWPGAEAPAFVPSLARGDGGAFARAVGSAYEAGLDIAFEELFAGENRRRVALPTYPFQRQRHWAPVPPRSPAAAGHPLLGVRRDSPGGEVSFEREFGDGDPGWLGDHRVFDVAVAPAALYAAQGLDAARASGRGPGVSLEEVLLHRPLLLPEEEGRTVQVMLGEGRGWKVVSRDPEGRWETHAEGALAPLGPGPAGVADLAALRAGLDPVEASGLYRGLETAGIAYGPAFRGLARLWRGAGEAFGDVELPSAVGRGGSSAPPVLLDACFQVVSGIPELAGEDGAWLPIGWDRFALRGALPDSLVCRAALSGDTGEIRKADLQLFSAAGEELGTISGFTLKRATRAALLGARVDDLLYEVRWRAAPPAGLREADFLAGPAAIGAGLGPMGGYLEAEGLDPEGLAVLGGALERESAHYVLRGFRELGWAPAPGERFEAEELRRRLGVTADHRRLFGRLLARLAGTGVLSREDGGSWLVEAAPDPPEAPRGPAESVEQGLLRRCGSSLAEVLRGRADPLELLFGGEPGAADLYRDSGPARAVHRMAADAVRAAVAGLPEGRRLQVLEVGAGTGAATAALLEALPRPRTAYEFTDVSAGFFPAAERRFGGGEMEFRCRTLDIERDPGEQGFLAHGYDVVVAANVLHATRDLGETLGHCRRLLAPSGLLVAVEGTEAQGWLDLTFGLLPGWWRFADGYRPDYALADGAAWKRVLADTGYGAVSVLDGGSGQAVILARGPAAVAPEPGVFVLSGGGAFAEDVGRELERRGSRAVAGPSGADRRAWGAFLESLSPEVPLRGVAYLAGLRSDGSGLSTRELAEELKAVGSGALALVQGMSDAGVRPAAGTWFVTRGGQVLAGERRGALSGAELWGFGAAAGLEHADLRPRLLDLDPEAELSAAALVDELLAPDRETRVARRGGERRAPRLVRSAAPDEEARNGPRGGPGPPAGRVRADRSYLVTGGLGGLGLEVAGWLAEAGAGAIVLNGRRAPDPGAEAVVADLRARGAEVRVEVVDVTDGSAVEDLLRRMDADLPPLGGVIHSVGVLADAALVNQDWERFEEVLRPKVLGAWRLHRATLGRDLDLFVLFSSLAGVLGSPGQANHAAANAFLDQLALHRRALGLPGQAIAWGAWSQVGEAEAQRGRIEGRLAAAGEGWITPQRGLRALDRVVGRDAGTQVVADVDWSALSGLPLLDEIAGAAPGATGAVPPAPAAAAVRRLDDALPAERGKLVAALVEEEVRSVLGLAAPPDPDAAFNDLGMDSLMAVNLRQRLNAALPRPAVSTTAVFEFSGVRKLADHLAAELFPGGEPAPAAAPARPPAVRREPAAAGDRIAVVGMACRLPGAPDLGAFWQLLREGRDAVTEGRPEDLGGVAGDRRFGAYVPGLDALDAPFFGIPAAEARYLDPQQRMLLEAAWTALEHAGMDPRSLRGSRSGVYAGIALSEYGALMASAAKDVVQIYRYLGNSPSGAVSRVARFFGLEGPALGVETACSSGMVAVHHAMAGLQRGEVDLALAGGVNTILQDALEPALEAGLLSPDGQTRAFDAAADGGGFGEGCGVLVLKRLADAEAAGDGILAVLTGSAVRQTAAAAGVSVPSRGLQQDLILEALARSGGAPADVDYLEASAGGSLVGDAVEAEAAAAAYGPGRDPGRPLLLGSVKSNLSNLVAAGGPAALIKVIESMRRRWIPKHLHFREPSPRVDWDRLPLRVVAEGVAWPARSGRPMRAGVSSYGLSGTIAHVVVEEYRPPDGPAGTLVAAPSEPVPGPAAARTPRVIPLSARSGQALAELAGRYRSWLGERAADSGGGELLADLAWTAGTGRSHLPYRAGLVAGDPETLDEALASVAAGKRAVHSRTPRQVAFVFGGVPRAGMGRGLYATEPVVREVLDRCERVVREEGDTSLLAVTFAEAGELPAGWIEPALVALGGAACALWDSLGVRPDVVAGAGAGALAGAVAAGVFTLEDAMRFAVRRRRTPAAVEAALAGLEVKPPSLPLLSAVTAEPMGADPPGSGYWSRAARKPASRRRLLSALAAGRPEVLVEAGAPAVSAAELTRAFGKRKPRVLASPLDPGGEGGALAAAAAAAYEAGLDLTFAGLFRGERRRRLRLPTYPFQRERYWFR